MLELIEELLIHFHLGLATVFRVLCLFHKLLVDIVFHIESRSVSTDSVLIGRGGRVVRRALEERQDCVKHKEDNEDVVEVESLRLSMCVALVVVEMLSILMTMYALKC